MKKGKLVLTVLSLVFGLVAAGLLVGLSVFEKLNFGYAPADVLEFAKGLIDFSALGLPKIIVLAVVGVSLLLSLVMLIVCLCKKMPKQIGTFIMDVVICACLAAVGVILIQGEPVFLMANIQGFGDHILRSIIVLLATALAALAFLFLVIASALYMAQKKATKEAVAAESAEAVASEAAANGAMNPGLSQEGGLQSVIVEETAMPKLVRRVLVNKSGKVVRVLNEHYIDVTTNIYYEPGVVYAEKPTMTEAEHFEELIGRPVIQTEPAVEEKPAPAPVVEEKPAPAPVVEEKPAPAPVVEEKAAEPVEVAKERAERIPFDVRIKKAEKPLKEAYNELKSELLSYGVKSRVSSTGDTFRLHKKTYAKVVVAGKSLKFYFALKPKDYKDSTFPIGDASGMNLYKEIPLIFKVKSDLSVRRAKQLIADAMAKDGLTQGEVKKHDWVKEIKIEK